MGRVSPGWRFFHDLDRRHAAAPLPRLELDALGEELPDGAARGQDGQGHERAGEAVDLAAREQPEDHQQGVQPQRAAHHVRHDHVALDLVDAQEEQQDPQRGERIHDEGVDERRDRTEPWTEVRDQLRDRHPRAEYERVLLPARERPDGAEQPDADAGTRPDDQRYECLPFHVADERVLHPHEQRVRARMRREAAVDRAPEAR